MFICLVFTQSTTNRTPGNMVVKVSFISQQTLEFRRNSSPSDITIQWSIIACDSGLNVETYSHTHSDMVCFVWECFF